MVAIGIMHLPASRILFHVLLGTKVSLVLSMFSIITRLGEIPVESAKYYTAVKGI